MAKMFKQSEGGNGIFVNKATIVNFEVNENASDAFESDFDFLMTLEFEKKTEEGETPETYEKKMFISGKLWKDQTIPKNWTDLLIACGFEDLEQELQFKIMDDFARGVASKELQQLMFGTKINTLQFVSGTYEKDGVDKPSYKFWNMNGVGFRYPNLWDAEIKVVYAEFQKKLKDDYAPPYTPEVLEVPMTESEAKAEEDSPTGGMADEDLI